MLAALREAVAIVLEVDPAGVSAGARLLEDLGADSLALVEIIDLTEAALVASVGSGFHFDDGALDEMQTLSDVVDHALRQDRVRVHALGSRARERVLPVP